MAGSYNRLLWRHPSATPGHSGRTTTPKCTLAPCLTPPPPPSSSPGLPNFSPLPSAGKHTKQFSYDELSALGLSKAIDEVHKLAETAPLVATPKAADADVPAPAGLVERTLKATVARPVPYILRPESLAACMAALWRLISYILYLSAPLVVPLLVWLALAPAAPVRLPKELVDAVPALKDAPLEPPADWRMRAGAVAAVLVLLRAAERAVASRAARRAEAADLAVPPGALDAFYAGSADPGAAGVGAAAGQGADVAAAEDWARVMAEVQVLSSQYDRPAAVRSKEDAVRWLQVVGRDVGLTLSLEAQAGAGAAARALEQVRRVLGA